MPVQSADERRRQHIAEVSGTRPFDLTLPEVLDGRVVLIRGGLQELGLFTPITQAALGTVRRLFGADVHDEVATRGFEQLHRVLTVRQAFQLRQELTKTFDATSTHLVRAVVGALRQPSDVYVCQHMYVRLMMPEDVVATERELLAEEFGHMIVHSPHRDSWFSHGSNSVNFWVAVGRVRPGNGMLLYPDARHNVLRRERTQIHPSERLGPPVSLHLDPGDILVFHSDHVHSSEVNVTDETRFVITTRLSVGAPRYQSGVGWIPYYDDRLLRHGATRWLASVRSRLTTAYLRHLGRAARRRLSAKEGQ